TVTVEYGHVPENLARLDEDEFWTDEEEEVDEEARLEEKKSNLVGKVVVTIQQLIVQFYVWLKIRTGGYLITALCLISYTVYFVLAMRFEKALYGLVLGTTVWTVISQGMKDVTNLRPVPGLFLFCLMCLLISTNPAKINWHTIFWGVGLQFLFALIILKFDFGKDAILWVQSRLDEFFKNSEEASVMLFGETYRDHYMVFGVSSKYSLLKKNIFNGYESILL
ncbi:sodium/nucleoside cotransporter, partial [Elysia marginata]